MNILALDLATKTGWAMDTYQPYCKDSGVVNLNPKDSQGGRFLTLRKWLEHQPYKFDLMVCEKPHFRGWNPTIVAVGLFTEVIAYAVKHSMDFRMVHTGTLKKWATGSGRASKLDMIKAATMKGWNPVDDNEADACLLLEYALEEWGK